MMIRPLAALSAVLFVIIVPPKRMDLTVVLAQEPPSATNQHGAFAFPNPIGDALLVTADVTTPERFSNALCSSGRHIPVRFERQQQDAKTGTGRQSPKNFGIIAGTVFRIVENKIAADAKCFIIASEQFVTGSSLVTLTPVRSRTTC